MNKKFVIAAAALMYFISAYFSYEFFAPRVGATSMGDQPSGPDSVKEAELEDEEFTGPRTEECPINGEMLTKNHRENWENRRPLGVMVENHLDARPQSGLSSSDVVYEFVAEGGITRFLVIYYCRDAKFIGPVRSARVYFIDMLRGYGEYPLYAHVGGANTDGPADALGMIADLKWGAYNDLNQFSVPFPTFYRDYARLEGVATEHTVYSSTSKLWKYANEKRELSNEDEDGVAWDSTFEPWTFDDGDPGAGTTTTIAYNFWDGKPAYDVQWDYDAETNAYTRSHGVGGKHIDLNTNKPLTVKNVMIMFVKESVANDGYEGQHMLYGTTGKGDALIFQNGDVIDGTWRKPDEEDQVRFYDSSGDELPIVRGRVWISALPIGNDVEY